MAAAAAALLVLALLAWSLAGLTRSGGAPDDGRDLRVDDLEAERRRLVGELRDLDLDLAMGKLPEGEHAGMKLALEERAVAVLAALERESEARPE